MASRMTVASLWPETDSSVWVIRLRIRPVVGSMVGVSCERRPHAESKQHYCQQNNFAGCSGSNSALEDPCSRVLLARRQAFRSGVASLSGLSAPSQVQDEQLRTCPGQARASSVADLFEAVVALMISPVHEDRAVADPVAVPGVGQL